MRVQRSAAALLPCSAILTLGWGYLWLVAGARGWAVHLVLAVAFALLVIWGLLRAT